MSREQRGYTLQVGAGVLRMSSGASGGGPSDVGEEKRRMPLARRDFGGRWAGWTSQVGDCINGGLLVVTRSSFQVMCFVFWERSGNALFSSMATAENARASSFSGTFGGRIDDVRGREAFTFERWKQNIKATRRHRVNATAPPIATPTTVLCDSPSRASVPSPRDEVAACVAIDCVATVSLAVVLSGFDAGRVGLVGGELESTTKDEGRETLDGAFSNSSFGDSVGFGLAGVDVGDNEVAAQSGSGANVVSEANTTSHGWSLGFGCDGNDIVSVYSLKLGRAGLLAQ